jgi:hypothetical protein
MTILVLWQEMNNRMDSPDEVDFERVANLDLIHIKKETSKFYH